MVKKYHIIYNHSPAVWGAFNTPNNKNPMQLMQFIITGLKRPKWKEINKLKGTKFKILLKLKEENIQLKKKEFSYFYKNAKINPAKAIADKKFSKLAAFFCTVIPTFQIYRGESIL